jgi:hypothetical protein
MTTAHFTTDSLELLPRFTSTAALRRQFVIFASIALLLVGLCACAPKSQRRFTISVQGGNIEQDAGKAASGQLIYHTFTIRNEDLARTVVITNIGDACECTTHKINSMMIGPLQETKYEMMVDTAGRQEDLRALTVISWKYEGEENLHAWNVALKIHFVKHFIVHPASIDFGIVRNGDPPKTSYISLTRADSEESWNDISINRLGNGIQVGYVQKDSDHYDIKVTINSSSMPTGSFGGGLTIRAFVGAKPVSNSLFIPISASIESDLKSAPKAIYFGVVPVGQSLEKTFTITSSHPIHFVSVESSNSACACAAPLPLNGSTLSFRCVFDSRGLHANRKRPTRHLL